MSIRKLAELFRASRKLRGGYVLFYRGEVIGWLREPLTAEIARYFQTGVAAVPEYRNAAIYLADGEPKAGATHWERMDPKYESID